MKRREFLILNMLPFITTNLMAFNFDSHIFSEIKKIEKNNDPLLKFLSKIALKPFEIKNIISLLNYLKTNNITLYKNKEIKTWLIFILLNNTNEKIKKEIVDYLYKNPYIPNEVIEKAKRRKNQKYIKSYLLKYKDRFFNKKNYENLLFFKLTNVKKINELKWLEEIESEKTRDNVVDFYFKSYFILLTKDFQYGNRFILNKVKPFIDSKYKKVEKLQKKQKYLVFGKKEDTFLIYLTTIASFLIYNPKYKKIFANYVKIMSYPNKPLFFKYDMYLFNKIIENYKLAEKYLDLIYKDNNYTGIELDLFNINYLAALQEFKNQNWKLSWEFSKNAIIIGNELDYKFYPKVIKMKSIFKISGINYIKNLLSTNNNAIAQEILDKTNKIIKLTYKSIVNNKRFYYLNKIH